MDNLKALSIQMDVKISTQDDLNMNYKVKSFRCLKIKNYKNFDIEIDEYGDLFDIAFKVNSTLAFSNNNPDRLFAFDKPVNPGRTSYNVFASRVDYTPLKSEYFRRFWNDFSVFINDLKLLPEETIYFYRNYICFGLHSGRTMVPIIDDITKLIGSHDRLFKKKNKLSISVKNVPAKFRPMIQLVKYWSIKDSYELRELITGLDEIDRNKLVTMIYPLMGEINAYLDSFDSLPLTEEAIVLGKLAELMTEIKNRK